jgi:hypothetical protein
MPIITALGRLKQENFEAWITYPNPVSKETKTERKRKEMMFSFDFQLAEWIKW